MNLQKVLSVSNNEMQVYYIEKNYNYASIIVYKKNSMIIGKLHIGVNAYGLKKEVQTMWYGVLVAFYLFFIDWFLMIIT